MAEALSRKTAATEESKANIRTRHAKEESALSEIQENPFYQVIFSDIPLEDKISGVTKLIEFTNNKEEDRAKVKSFDSFKEYLQSISEEMSKQRIAMTDTEVFAELQRVYGEFNNDLNDFVDKIKPLTDITDALYKLRQDGNTRDAIAKIKEDLVWETEAGEMQKTLTAEVASIKTQIQELENGIITLAQDKGLFGFGQIRPASKAKILTNEAAIKRLKEDLSAKQADLDTTLKEMKERKAKQSESFEIQKLRDLLDLTSEGHTQRQADMVASALNFVNSGKERFGAIRGHLDKMVTQIEGLGDNNSHMRQIFASINKATKEAEGRHLERRKALDLVEVPADDLVAKMRHDEECQNLDEHIDTMVTTAADTMQSYADLTMEETKIKSMQAATKKQMESARAMHSRGIASVASHLSTVVTAVNSAAINEAQSMASSTLSEMAKVTNEIARSEAIRIATGRGEINLDLEAVLQDLADYGDTQREATEITREAIKDMRANLEDIERIAHDVQGANKEFSGVAADVMTEKTEKVTKKPLSGSPFKL